MGMTFGFGFETRREIVLFFKKLLNAVLENAELNTKECFGKVMTSKLNLG